MVISRSITRNLRSTVFSLHRQELMAVTTLLPVYKQWGYKTSLTDEETLYPLPFTVLLGISAQLYRHPATSNTLHSILVNVTETSFKYYAGQYNLPSLPVPDADGWWFAFGIS